MDGLLNWLWQGAAVALAAAALLRMIDPSHARVRYWVVWVALSLVLVLPAVPLFFATAAVAPAIGDVAAHVAPVVSIPSGRWASVGVLGLWTLWAGVYAGRIGYALVVLRRVRHQCRQFPPAVEEQLRCWNRVRATGRRARIVLSDGVRSAAVLGGGSPVIAVAPRLLDHLGPEELDRVVIHEWAHVQRRDDLSIMAQALVRAVVGWHPAAWWLDRQLHLERESCCDETAVAVTGSSPKAYAACLAKLVSLPAMSERALPVVAVSAPSGVRTRIVRILSRRPGARVRSMGAVLTGAGLVLAGVAVSVGGVRVFETAAETNVAATAPSGTGEATASGAGTVVRSIVPEAVGVAAEVAVSDPPAAMLPQGAPLWDPARAEEVIPRTITPELAQVMSEPISAPAPPQVLSASLPTLPRADARSSATEAADRRVGGGEPTSFEPASQVQDPPASERGVPVASGAVELAPDDTGPASPWRAAAATGTAIGRTSQNAALATAGVFTRFGKRLAGSF